MTPKLLQASWKVGMVFPEDIPTRALELLEAGFETPAVVTLAGLLAPTRSDVEPILEKAFAQLGLPPQSDDEAGREAAYDYARRIVAGEIAPRAGAEALGKLANVLGLPETLTCFVYLAADYGEGPKGPMTEAAWFDTKIIESAAALLRAGAADASSR